MTPREHEALADARESSRGCMWCKGAGLVTVYSPSYRGEPLEEVSGHIDLEGACKEVKYLVPAMANAHCVCPYGRWLRAFQPPAIARRSPDLAHILAGQSRWIARNPMEEG